MGEKISEGEGRKREREKRRERMGEGGVGMGNQNVLEYSPQNCRWEKIPNTLTSE